MVSSHDDILRLGAPGPGSRRRRLVVAAAALALVVSAAGVAWHLARGGSPEAAPSPSAASSRFTATDTLADMGTRCSDQHGSQLWLGIQLRNTSGSPATIDRVRVELPLGGLRVVSIHRSQCTAQGDRLGGFTLDDRQHTWVSAVFDVLVGCPKPLPVWFVVEYTLQGQTETLSPSGFADLWRVDYTGCAA